jgi:hypothetical protein
MTTKPADRVRVQRVSAERLLGSLPDRSIDLVITDPPYTSINRSSTSGHLRDWFPDGLTWPQIGRVFAIARRKLKPDGVLMAMTNNDGLREAIGALERAGFIGIRTITWDRQYPGLGGGLRHQTEFVLVGRLTGSRTLSGVDLVSVAAVGPGTADRYPTAKPEGLGRQLAAMAGVGRGSLVVDPFCGSGALLVGAAERGASVVAGDVAQRAVQQARVKLAQASPAQRRSRPHQASGSGRTPTATRPAKSGKPTGSGRSTLATRPAKSGKPNGSSRPATPGKPNGSSRPATPGKPTGSGRTPTATRPTKSGKPNASGRPAPTTRPAGTRKPNGSGRSTRVTRPVPRGSARPIRPGSRP